MRSLNPAFRAHMLTSAMIVTVLAAAPARPAPADLEDPDDAHSRAEAMLRSGDNAGAARVYAEILELSKHDGPAMDGRVRALLLQDLWVQALDEARSHYAAVPGDPLCASSLGEALVRAGRLDEARELLEPLATQPTPPARLLMTLARLEAALGRNEEATALMNRALALSPDDRELVLHASSVAPDRPEAIRRLERFLELSEGADPDRTLAARETLNMLRRLGDKKLWIRKSHPERLELPLRRVIDANRRHLGYAIEARFGASEKPVRLLLDTGASGLHVVDRVARKNRFQPLARTTMFGGGDDQRHATRRGTFATFAIGDLEFTNALASVSSGELEPTGRFHGLLGISAFDGYLVTLDLKKQRLLLEPSPPEFDGSTYWMFNGQMLVRAGTPDGIEGLFLFDTGAGTSLLGTSFVENVPAASLSGTTHVRAFGGQVQGAQIARGLRVAFQELQSKATEFRAVDLSMRSRLGGVEISGFLGLDMIKGSRIVIDTASRSVKVLPAGSR